MSYRDDILRCLGRFPEKCDLNPEVIEHTDYGTHVLQLVAYNVEENDRITAYLLLPRNIKDKNPTILASHQHAGEYHLGKSEPAGLSANSMYHYALDLCLRGYIVLCPDHLCFEDRRPTGEERAENYDLDGMAYERLMFCKYLLDGSSLQAKYLSDLTVGLDYLQSLPFVDSDRIGAIGHSLGGQETLWLSWYDERIKAAVSSCGFSQIKNIMRDNINHNYAMFVNGLFKHGDIKELLLDMSPKPFMMTNGDADRIFPIDGVYEIAEAVGKAYSEKGLPENFASVVFEGGHSFPPEVKEKAYGWLDKYLKN